MDPSGVTEVMIDAFCYGLASLAGLSWLLMIYFGAIYKKHF